MAGEKAETSSLPIGNLLAIVLLIAGVAVNHLPLESARPGASAVKTGVSSDVQNVDARLWQDPLAVISLYREEHRTKGDASTAEGSAHQISLEVRPGSKDKSEYLLNASPIAVPPASDQRLQQLKKHINAQEGQGWGVVVLGAMMFGGPYAEEAESRRRTRYAVLAGLDVSGYKPEDAENLGYFTNAKNEGVPEVVPFEFLTNQNAKCKILLLWLDENAFDSSSPLRSLNGLMQKVAGEHEPAKVADCGPRVRIIGPAGSWFLENMAGEVAQAPASLTNPSLELPEAVIKLKYEFYSWGVTTDLKDAFVAAVNDAIPENKRKEFKIGIESMTHEIEQDVDRSLFRTINTDAQVASALVAELGLRGVHPGIGNDHILLVSEWDTAYGQRLPKEFIQAAASAVTGHQKNPGNGKNAAKNKDEAPTCDNRFKPRWVTCISYLRGLDGDIPPSSASAQAAAKNDKSKDDKDKAKDAANREHAEGTSQFDYLRALATRVEERVLEVHNKDAGEIKAIGVLGSDLYDKLLVLQALRPQFPKAIFFTTDLDARLVQPSNYQWTRNLLVGAGYGFELNAGLQKNIPPFRDVYQTSTFLATQLALSSMLAATKQEALKCWLRPPRVYEIGRTQAFALQPQSEEYVTSPSDCESFVRSSLAEIARASTPDSAAVDPCRTLAGCKDIRPPLPGLFPHDSLWVWLSVCGVFGLLLLYSYSWWIRRTVDAAWQSTKVSSVIAIVISSLAVLAVIVIANAEHGEPFAWAKGISLWPTQLVRLLALVLCACFIYRVLCPDEKLEDEIPGEFIPALLDEAQSAKVQRNVNDESHDQSNVAQPSIISQYYHLLFKWFENYRSRSGSIDVATLWREYRAFGTLGERKHRLWLPAVCYVLVCVGLILAYGGLPNTPYRGHASLYVNGVLLFFLTFAFTLLLFLVVDSIRLCSTFIRNLTKGRSDYPAEIIEKFRNSINFDPVQPGCYLCDWIDVRLIAQLTERIGEQVYYPFIVLALMLVARSPLFDYWHTPVGLMLVFALGFALAIVCAVVLQRNATRAQDIAVERMTRLLTQVKGAAVPNVALVAQLGILLDEVKNLHRGAFVPFMQQPLVLALMVPVGSFGGLQLVEYFVLNWYL